VTGSHRGPIFEHFDDAGRWTGALSARDAATLPVDRLAEMCGPAGTVVLIHCRVVHGSAASSSTRLRPLLLNVYSAADTLADHAGAVAHEARPACWCEARSPCTSTWSHIRPACRRAGTRSAIARSSPPRPRQI
jgi:hypothetical protein